MEQQQLFNLSHVGDDSTDGTLAIRPNLWLMSTEEIPPILFTVEEVARFLSIGRHRVFDLIREGGLRSVKLGSSRRVSARALSDYVAQLELGDTT